MNSLWLVLTVLFLLNNVLWSEQAERDTSPAILTHKWVNAEFAYPNEKAKYDALKQGQLIPKNLIIFDADYHPSTNRYFVTTPPFRNGTPSTLAEVVRGGNLLKPFPTWSNGNNTDKNACQRGPPLSVYRIHIDKCGLLWVPDTGIYEVLAATQLTCQPSLWIYDLNRGDRLLLRYEFPQNVITSRSLPVNVITESYRSDCSDSIAYIADVMDHGLIVFDYAKKSSWRVEHKYFYMFPTAPTMHCNGVSLDLNDGLCGLALSPASDQQERKLYFHSLASVHESWVPVCVLKNETLAKDPFVARDNFHLSPGQREGHSTVEVMTDDGILIYPIVTSNAIYCWNSRTQYTSENQHVLKKDDENFQFISGMKLSGNKLVIMASRFQNYLLANLSETDYNYRLLVIDDVKRLIQNSGCSSKSYANTNGGDSSSSFCAELRSSSNVYTPSSGNHWASYYGSSANNQKSSMTNMPSSVHATTTVPQPRDASYTNSVPTTPKAINGVIFKPKPHSWSNAQNNKDINLDGFTQNRMAGESDNTLTGPPTANKTLREGPTQVMKTQTFSRNS